MRTIPPLWWSTQVLGRSGRLPNRDRKGAGRPAIHLGPGRPAPLRSRFGSRPEWPPERPRASFQRGGDMIRHCSKLGTMNCALLIWLAWAQIAPTQDALIDTIAR